MIIIELNIYERLHLLKELSPTKISLNKKDINLKTLTELHDLFKITEEEKKILNWQNNQAYTKWDDDKDIPKKFEIDRDKFKVLFDYFTNDIQIKSYVDLYNKILCQKLDEE